MKKIITIILYFVLPGTYMMAAFGDVEKQTIVYSIKGTDTLRLDKYELLSEPAMSKPCMIFVFGGGFSGGARDEKSNVAFMHEVAKNGCVGIAIDYRLGMKSAKGAAGQITPEQFTALLLNSVNMAVEDLFDATTFVYEHAGEWNINDNQIIACGSSAGAITVLQGEYLICNKQDVAIKRLPAGFNYDGVVAFAGAILSPLPMQWATSPAPIQLFHGDADRNVPFDKLEVEGWGLYGSKCIAEQLTILQSPFYFYEVINAAHEMAGKPMRNNIPEIKTFIERFVIEKQPFVYRTQVQEIGKPEMKKVFILNDFIEANYK